MATRRFIDFWRRHWILGWSLFAILFFVALAAIGAAKNANDAAHELAEVIAKLDRDDPGWRLADMIAARPKPPPDHQNSVNVTRQAGRALTKPLDYLDIDSTHPPPELLADDTAKSVKEQLLDRNAAVILARSVSEFPIGQLPIEFTKDGVPTFDGESHARSVAELLAIDILDRLQAGDMAGAERSILAILHVARPFRDEPFVIPVLIRDAILQEMLEGLSLTLARGELPRKSHLPWRDRLIGEANVYQSLDAMRGGRASANEWMQSLTRTEFADFFFPKDDKLSVFPHDFWVRRLFPDQIKIRGCAWHLRRCWDFAKIRDLPESQRRQAVTDFIQNINSEARTNRSAKLMGQFMRAWTLKTFETESSLRARLRCAAAAMAAEEFRSTRMRWPESLDELVAAGLLTEVPLDPFADAPFQLRRVKDGIVIHSVGPKGDYAGDAWDDPEADRLDRTPQTSLEFRLWDPEHRRQPARPRPKRDIEDIPPEP